MIRMSQPAIAAMSAFLVSADAPQAEPQPRRRLPTIRERVADDLLVYLPSNADWVHRTLNSMTDAELARLPAVAPIDLTEFADDLELN